MIQDVASVSIKLLFWASIFASCNDPREAAVDTIPRSHSEANAPENTEADAILRHDLRSYFRNTAAAPVDVDFTFLRRGPTQSGVAYPKYYLWVSVKDSVSGALVSQGAARIAAIDRTRFDVTHYLRRSDIIADPASLDTIFPAPVIAAIKKRL